MSVDSMLLATPSPLSLGGTNDDTPAGRFILSIFDGTAPREPNGCILWPFGLRTGYAVTYWVPPHGRRTQVSRLVLEHFVGPAPSPRHTAGHAPHEVCGNRSCVALEHLSWQSWEEQIANQKRDGTFVPPPVIAGPTHHSAKVSDEVGAAAVLRVWAGELPAHVSKDVGVAHITLSRWLDGTRRPEILALARRLEGDTRDEAESC